MNKTTILAVLVFAGLIGATAYTLREKPERGITRLSFTNVSPAEIDRVVISGPNAIELRREGDAWKAGDKAADADAVTRLLESIQRMESSELATRNAERFAEMQVDDDKGARVQVFSKGKTVADFVVGGSVPGGTHVRAADGVYAVKGVFSGTFSRTRSAWYDRRLFTDKPEEVTRVEVALSAQKPWALVKQDTAWRLEDATALAAGQRFDAQAAASLVQSLVNGRALDLPDQDPGPEGSGLTDAADRISFQLAAGSPAREIRLGKDAEGGTVYARVSTRPDLVTLPSSLAKSLRKQPSDLRDLTVMAFDPSAATRLAVTRDGKKVVFEKADGKWKVADSSDKAADGFELDETSVSRRVAAIAGVRALAEADAAAAKSAQLEKPAATAAITLGDGRVVELSFGAETKHGEDTAVFARGNADGGIYLVRSSLGESLLAGLDSFAKRADAGAGSFANLDPSKLEGLPPEVRQALLQKMAEEKQKQRIMEQVQAQQAPAAAPH